MHSPRLILKQVEMGPMANFVYLVGCSTTREAAVVDPAWDVPAILRIAQSSDLHIRHILITHGHPDHVNGLEALLEATDARVYLHSDEVDYMKLAAGFFNIPVDFMKQRSANFKAVGDNDEVMVGQLAVRFMHTPGHTPGSQCFVVEENLVSGDTLFINACGRVDLPGGDPEKMWWSLNRRLAELGDDTVLYPGHNYAELPTSTIGEQKRTNPYMQFTTVQRFLDAMQGY